MKPTLFICKIRTTPISEPQSLFVVTSTESINMTIKTLFIWLMASLPVWAEESKLLECSPRNGDPNFIFKMEHGIGVRVACFGGSITAQEGWRPKTLNWFQNQYPQATINEINAAIGGTGSDLGAFRLRQDVLDNHPYLIFVEFAVNDRSYSPQLIYRTMDGIVRQTWHHDPTTDICFVYTIAADMLEREEKGELPPSIAAIENIADHYGIPSINMGLGVAQLEKAGKLIFQEAKPTTAQEKQTLGQKIIFSPDGIHPYTDTVIHCTSTPWCAA
jgi:hypothetical protein